MGKQIKGIFRNPVKSILSFASGGLLGLAASRISDKKDNNTPEASPVSTPTSASTPAAQPVQEYKTALDTHSKTLADEQNKRQSELAAATKSTQEGIARSSRARRSGGIFNEKQTTAGQQAGSSLG
jgi:hypothetical protein